MTKFNPLTKKLSNEFSLLTKVKNGQWYKINLILMIFKKCNFMLHLSWFALPCYISLESLILFFLEKGRRPLEIKNVISDLKRKLSFNLNS